MECLNNTELAEKNWQVLKKYRRYLYFILHTGAGLFVLETRNRKSVGKIMKSHRNLVIMAAWPVLHCAMWPPAVVSALSSHLALLVGSCSSGALAVCGSYLTLLVLQAPTQPLLWREFSSLRTYIVFGSHWPPQDFRHCVTKRYTQRFYTL